MKTRILTAIVAIALFVPVCIFSHTIFFSAVMSILSVVGVYEISKCLGQHKRWAITIPMYIISAILPIARRVLVKQSHFFSLAMIAIFFMLIYCLTYVMLRKNQDKISDVITLYGLFVYVVGCFSSIVCVREMAGGKYIYLLIFLGAWVCDTFAYFTGKFLGKHKLIPEISPKKTIEGSIGGIVFTIGAFVLYGFIVNKNFGDEIKLSYILLVVLGLASSIISQVGDLVASAVKRQYDIKDYGKLFPGHGGVLDRFDSVMLVAPITYVIFLIASFF